ncbi:RHS repeat-associated core domain-containing protein [Pseudomonas fluorescens]|uniref:RHS repeat-associated core domain-containing protein n=1 Tax=Pseudomonas fluorescens TaxID=294 RepID=A0A5E7ET53_PSEFL|nr:RHS repeat-associated core domain-containing protein [Pseudomonas fluorescens]VVO29874.1 hypothetical protein PS723_04900 [Pseudomonas fluorescens]
MAHSITNDHNNSTPPNVLLAIDNKNSVLAEVVAGQTNHIAYSAYGYQSARQEVMTRLGFNGELREMHTSWYLLGNGYRPYIPRLMRFHSPDSWSPFGAGGLNAYRYCSGEPVINSDPSGHEWWSPISRVTSTIFGSRRSPTLRLALQTLGIPSGQYPSSSASSQRWAERVKLEA